MPLQDDGVEVDVEALERGADAGGTTTDDDHVVMLISLHAQLDDPVGCIRTSQVSPDRPRSFGGWRAGPIPAMGSADDVGAAARPRIENFGLRRPFGRSRG